jgi:hypothetical protein
VESGLFVVAAVVGFVVSIALLLARPVAGLSVGVDYL